MNIKGTQYELFLGLKGQVKTSILFFSQVFEPNISIFSAFNKTVNIKGTQYKLLLVDTAGQDEYSKFSQVFEPNISFFSAFNKTVNIKGT